MSTHVDQESLRRQVAVLESRLDRRSKECEAKQKIIEELEDKLVAQLYEAENVPKAVTSNDAGRKTTLGVDVAELYRKIEELEADNTDLKTDNGELRKENQSLRAVQERTILNCRGIHHHLSQSLGLIEDVTGVATPTATALRDRFSFDEGSLHRLSLIDPSRNILGEFGQSTYGRTEISGESTETPLGLREWQGVTSSDSHVALKEPHQEEPKGVKEKGLSDVPRPRDTSSQSHQAIVVDDGDMLIYKEPDDLAYQFSELSVRPTGRTRSDRTTPAKTFAAAVSGSSNTGSRSEGRRTLTTFRSSGGPQTTFAENESPVPLKSVVSGPETGNKPESLATSSKPTDRAAVDIAGFEGIDSQVPLSQSKFATGPPQQTFVPPPEIERKLWNIGKSIEDHPNPLQSQKQESPTVQTATSELPKDNVKVEEQKEPAPISSTAPSEQPPKIPADPKATSGSGMGESSSRQQTDIPPARGQESKNEPDNQQGNKSGNQLGSQPRNQQGGTRGSQRGNRPGNHPGSQRGNQPGNQPGNKPENHPGSQRGNRHGNQPGRTPRGRGRN